MKQARQYEQAIAPDETEVHYRTLPRVTGGKGARNHHGNLDTVARELADRNALGFGVFFTINAGGTKAREITHPRAFYLDFDKPCTRAELGLKLARCPFPPTMIVESSPGKWHVYWIVDGCPVEVFTHYLKAFAAFMGSDHLAATLHQVLRVPGFYHTKGEPFQSRLAECYPELGYPWPDFRAMLATVGIAPPPPPPPPRKAAQLTPPTSESERYTLAAVASAVKAIAAAPEGERNHTLNREAIGPLGLVKDGHGSKDAVFQAFTTAALACGLDEGEIMATLNSAYRAATARGVPEADSVPTDYSVAFGAPQGFAKYVITQTSEQMAAQMLADIFVLGLLAINGQFTVFYGGPNMGKTLLTIWLLIERIKSGDVTARDVFYINADDTYKGMVEKKALAEQYGFNMLAPGHSGFKAPMMRDVMQGMTANGTARGCIVIIDTVKKFTDLMDKKEGSRFTGVAREFVAAGGTIVGLAHVNKHKAGDGSSIHAGTSDMVDDSDCVYILELVEDNGMERVVKFRNVKDRGDVAQAATYAYKAKTDTASLTWRDLFDSVHEVSLEQAHEAERRALVADRLAENSEVIQVIRECIPAGRAIHKTELIQLAMDLSGFTKKRVTKVLADHTGGSHKDGHFWTVSVGDNNSHCYSALLIPPGEFFDE
ncbi:MAG: hypothetical protein DRQ62_06250 [Gammaproteobacteria bacterium]|nr:MAG: hypothetical protein DRQ62_06250 [Gammaproteobacteria bacterium]